MSDTQQAPAPKKSHKKLIIIVIVIIVLVALIGSCASGAGNKSDSSNGSGNSGSTASQGAQQEKDSTKIDADKFAKIENGKVTNKSQIGVNDQSTAKATMDKYNQVETGMTYDEVVAIMGGDGELSSDTKIAGVSSKLYMWDGENIASNCSITFSDGKVSSKSQFGLDKEQQKKTPEVTSASGVFSVRVERRATQPCVRPLPPEPCAARRGRRPCSRRGSARRSGRCG